jgi:hypothetical protein
MQKAQTHFCGRRTRLTAGRIIRSSKHARHQGKPLEAPARSQARRSTYWPLALTG